MPAHRRARKGLVRTFQINQLFDSMTPMEAVALAMVERNGGGAHFWRPLARDAAIADESARVACAPCTCPTSCSSRPRCFLTASGGLLEIAIALASRPRVLLLDEPVAGVPATESREILETLAALPVGRHRAADRTRHGPRVSLRDRAFRCSSTAPCSSKAPPRKSPGTRAFARCIWAIRRYNSVAPQLPT